jgi:hypothetical protein
MKTQIFASIICVLLIGLMLRQPPQAATLTTPQIASKLDAIQTELAQLLDRAVVAAEQDSELVAALAELSGNQLELADAMSAVLLSQQPASAEKITKLKTIDRPKTQKTLSNVMLVSAIDETTETTAKLKDAFDGNPDLESRVTALEAELATLKAACQNCNCIAGSLQYKLKASGGSNGTLSYSPYTTTTTTTYSTKSGGSNGSYVQNSMPMATVAQPVRIVHPRTVTRATVNQAVPMNVPMEEQVIQYDPNMVNSQCVQLADGSYDCGGSNVSRNVPTVQTTSRPRVFPNLFRGR